MKADHVSVIEASYLVEETHDEAWLMEVLQRARPCLDRGLGLAAYFTDYTRPPGHHALSPMAVGCPDGWRATFDAMLAPKETSAEAVVRQRRPGSTVTTLSADMGPDLFARLQSVIQRFGWPLGMRDWLGIKVADPSGRGLIITAPLPRVSRPSRTTVLQWSRIASHIAAGYRLRRRLAAGPPGPPALPDNWSAHAEAILQADGRKLADAKGAAQASDAREALLFAAAQRDRARGRLRRTDPERAVAIWLGLVAGRWSLVDQEDRDGRRYVLAYRNAPEAGDQHALTERERQVLAYAALGHSNKLIAYELGIAPSTISGLLARARRKLGASSKSECLALCRTAARPEAGPRADPRAGARDGAATRDGGS